jgi:virginiamycin A acetyltransferase
MVGIRRRIDWLKQRIRTRLRPSDPASFSALTATLLQPQISLYGWAIGAHSYGNIRVLEPHMAKLSIGKFTSIAGNVAITLGDHATDTVSSYPFVALQLYWPGAPRDRGSHTTKGDVVIGNDVWIADSVFICSGVTVGDGAVIGAGSVVTKDVAPYAIVAGAPAIVRRYRFTEDEIASLLRTAWWTLPDAQVNELLPWITGKDIALLVAKVDAIRSIGIA